jgi:hypothetical protein
VSINATVGVAFTITATATGGANISYQWYRATNPNGPYAPVGGVTSNNVLTQSEPAEGVFYYRAAAWSDCEQPKTEPGSNITTVTVERECDAVTSVTVAPDSANVATNVSFTITASAVGGTNIRYQWYRAANAAGPYTPIAGQTNVTVTMSESSVGTYYYRVAAWSSCEPARTEPNSDTSVVTVTASCRAVTSVTVAPDTVNVVANASFTITSNVVGGENVRYQWYRATTAAGPYVPVAGQTNSTLTMSESSPGTYYYRVAAWSDCEPVPNSPNSNTSVVKVTPYCSAVTSVTVTPTSINVTPNTSFTVTANVAGGANIQYQWYRSTSAAGPFVALAGQTSVTLTTSEPAQGTYYYRVAAWSDCEPVPSGPNSNTSTVTVDSGCDAVTSVSVTPTSINVTTGATFTITANAVGGTNVQYQWYRATNSAGPYTAITGVVTSNVLSRDESAAGTYYYRVAAWSDCEQQPSGPNSNTSTVTVTECNNVTAVTIAPASISVATNVTFTITSSVTGGANVRYQWYRATSAAGPYAPVGGQTGSSITISESSPGTYYYRLAAWSDCEPARTEPNSNTSTVTVTAYCDTVRTVTVTPTSISVASGVSFSISSNVAGGTNVRYQWYRATNSAGTYSPVGGQTGSTLTMSEAASGTYYYRVAAWSSCEPAKTEPNSDISTVTVTDLCLPVTTVTVTPPSITVTAGASFTLTANAVGGTNVRYQWYRATNPAGTYSPVAGATGATLTASESAAGTYYFRVAAWSNCETEPTEPNSNISTVIVMEACNTVTSVAASPPSVSVTTNTPFTLTASAVGGSNIRYQWYRATNATGPYVPIGGQTVATLTMSESSPGIYYYGVAAWSDCEPARTEPNSNIVTVTVTLDCNVVTDVKVIPVSINVVTGAPFSLTSYVTGGTNIQYQWYRATNLSGPYTPIGGQTGSTLTTSEAVPGTYYYKVAAWSYCEPAKTAPDSDVSTVTVTSSCAAVTAVTVTPTSINASPGVNFTITAVVTGGTNIQYQWYRATNQSGPYTAVTGISSNALLIRSEPAEGTYFYRVAAWSNCDSTPKAPNSNTSIVTVTEGCDAVTSVTVSPTSVATTAGASFIITANAVGGTNIQYRWYRSVSLSGTYVAVTGISASNVLNYSEPATGTYYYRVAAWSNCEPIPSEPNSNTSVVTVTPACDTVLSVTVTPVSVNATANVPFTLTANAVGGTNVQYQWYRALSIGGPYAVVTGVSASRILTRSEPTPGTYYYRVAAWSSCETPKTGPNSDISTVTVSPACDEVTDVAITPAVVNITANTSFTLTANAAGGANIQYQWYRAANAGGPYTVITGVTSSNTLTRTESSTGVYYYRVAAWSDCENPRGEPNSNISIVTVLPGCDTVTRVTVAPDAITVTANVSFTVTANAIGGAGVQYQWYRAVNPSGPYSVVTGVSSSSVLTRSEPTPGTYYYRVAAWSNCELPKNEPVSNISTVTVIAACNAVTDVTIVPSVINVAANVSFTITANAVGGANIRYQWYRATNPAGPYTIVTGVVTNSVLTRTEPASGVFYYRAAAWSDCELPKNAPDSNISTVTVLPPCASVTSVTLSPVSLTVAAGASFLITANAVGGTGIRYQWYRAASAAGHYTVITGVVSSNILNRTESTPGTYYYRVAAWSDCELPKIAPDPGTSTVTVTDACVAVTSVSVSPTSVSATPGVAFTITANAVGGTNIQYQWYRAASISGPYISVTGISPNNVLSYVEPLAGIYYFRVAAWSDCETPRTDPNSGTSTVTVCDAVRSVTLTPTSVDATPGVSFTLTANAVGGTNIRYQLYRAVSMSGPYIAVTGAVTNNVFNYTEPTAGVYYYRVAAWSDCETPKKEPDSGTSTVTVCDAVTSVTLTPASVSAMSGVAFTLTANTVGGTNIRYQWYRAVSMSGPYIAVTGVLTTNVLNRTEPVAGTYYYRVAAWSDCENPKTEPNSDISTVTVNPACNAVTSVTVSPTTLTATAGAAFTITANAVGGTNIQYQWYRATNMTGPYTAIGGVSTSNVLNRTEPVAGTFY